MNKLYSLVKLRIIELEEKLKYIKSYETGVIIRQTLALNRIIAQELEQKRKILK